MPALGTRVEGPGVWLALAAVILLYIAARLWHLSAVCLDGDEIFSLAISRLSWRELTLAALRDSVHPPLFYYLLKLWTALFGNSLFALRSLPMLFSVAALAPMLYLCRRLRLTIAETCCLVGISALHPMLVYYAQHLRMYSLLFFCATLSLALFVAVLRAPSVSGWALLTLANIALLYAHYYGTILIAIEGVSVLLWYRRITTDLSSRAERSGVERPCVSCAVSKTAGSLDSRQIFRFAFSALVTLAAFGPWLYGASAAASNKGGLATNLGWVPRPGLRDLLWFFYDLAGCADLPGASVITLCLWIVILVAVLRALRYPARRDFLMLLLVVVVPVCATFALSRLLPESIWGHRHLVFTVVPFLLICTLAWRLAPHALRIGALVVLGAWACVILITAAGRDHRKLPWDTLVATVALREAAASPAGEVDLYAMGLYIHYPISFYMDALKHGDFAGVAALPVLPDREPLAAAARLRVQRALDMNSVRGGHFWIAYSVKSWPGASPEILLAARACRLGEPLSSSDRFDAVRLFPAWCPAP